MPYHGIFERKKYDPIFLCSVGSFACQVFHDMFWQGREQIESTCAMQQMIDLSVRIISIFISFLEELAAKFR